jgi:hypothetical protein
MQGANTMGFLFNFELNIRKADVSTSRLGSAPLQKPRARENVHEAEKQEMLVHVEGYECMHIKDRSTWVLLG